MNIFLNPASTPPAVQLKSTGAPLASMRLKRGAEVPLVVTLLGVQEASNLRLGLKAAHEGDILALASAETGTPCEAGISFTLSLVVRSDALDAALHVGEATSLAKLNAMAEFVWEEDGQTRISDTVTVALLNDIVRSSTTTPGDGTEVYPSVEALATKAWVRNLRASAEAAGLVLLESDAVLEGEHTAVALTAAGAIAVPKATRSVCGTVLLGTDNVLNGLYVLPVGKDADGRLAVDASGLSAYDLAVKDGFVGTAEDWLASLKGEPGDTGPSAYDVALEQGFVGTEDEWLASLKGERGDAGLTGEQVDERVLARLDEALYFTDHSTQEGTGKYSWLWCQIYQDNIPVGELRRIRIHMPTTLTPAYTEPIYLAVWQYLNNSWTAVACSLNKCRMEAGKDMVFEFAPGTMLELHSVRLCPGGDDGTAVWRTDISLTTLGSPTSDGSQLRQPGTVNAIPYITFTMAEPADGLTLAGHAHDSVAHLTEEEHAGLLELLASKDSILASISAE